MHTHTNICNLTYPFFLKCTLLFGMSYHRGDDVNVNRLCLLTFKLIWRNKLYDASLTCVCVRGDVCKECDLSKRFAKCHCATIFCAHNVQMFLLLFVHGSKCLTCKVYIYNVGAGDFEKKKPL